MDGQNQKKEKILVGFSVVLFVLFCVAGPTGHPALLGAVAGGILQNVGFLAGIGAWTLMCVALGARRRSAAGGR